MNVLSKVTIALAVCSAALAADPPKRVKLATLLPKDSSAHKSLLTMGAAWAKIPTESVALTVYADGSQGDEAQAVRLMRSGNLDASLLSVAGLEKIDRSVTALQYMPMVYRSLEEVDYVREKLRPMLDARLREQGFVALFWGDAGWVRIFSTKPVKRPDDLKALSTFVLQGDVRQSDLMKTVGFRVAPLEYGDILTSIGRLVEAVPTIPYYAETGQFYTKAQYMLDINYVPLVGALVVRSKVWDALAPATREAMQRAAEEAGNGIRLQSRKEMNESVAAMTKRGLKVTAMTPDLEKEWRGLFESVYPKLRGDLVPADMFDEVNRLLREFRK